MSLYKFTKGQLYKLVFCRIISVNGKTVIPDKEKVFRMWIPVKNKD